MNSKYAHKHKYAMPKIFIFPDPEDMETKPTEYTTEWSDFKMSKYSDQQRFYSCNSDKEPPPTLPQQDYESHDSNHCDTSSFHEKPELNVEFADKHNIQNYDESSVDEQTGVTCMITVLAYLIVVLTFPFSLLICIKIVQEYERAVIFRLGRLTYGGAKGPGIFFILPCIETYTKVDLRTISFDVPPQEVLTRDSVTVTVDAVVNYRICNAVVSVANVEDAHHSTRLIAQSTLRNVLGTKNLSEILSERESIGIAIQDQLTSATYPWGIQMERVEIKDCRLPKILQRSMAAEAEAAREARAKEIASEGEKCASQALKEASKILNESSTAIQLRYLQTLINVANEKTSTIIFPLPVGLLQLLIESRAE